MDVLSVSEAFMYALEAVGKEYQYIASGQTVLRTVPEIMEANGWYAMKNTAGEILYYTRPAQAVLETGVKTYTEVAEVTAVTTESGAVTGATVTTSGVGVSVATSALACAVTAAYGYNIGNQIYEVNPSWWDGLLKEIDEWTVENVPENGINAVVTVLEGVDSVLTFPSSLLEKIKIYSIDTGVFKEEVDVNVPVSAGTTTVTNLGWNESMVNTLFSQILSTAPKTDALVLLSQHAHDSYVDASNKFSPDYPVTRFSLNTTSDGSSAALTLYGQVAPNNNEVTFGRIREDSYGNKCAYGDGVTSLGRQYMIDRGNFSTTDLSENNLSYMVGKDYSAISCHLSSLNAYVEKAVNGTSLQEDATYPSKDAPISETYPDWWNKAITINNGMGGSTSWLPVSITDKNAEYFGDPQTQAESQSGTKTKTENSNIQVVDTAGVLDIPNNPPTDDKGSTPVLFPPTSIFGIAGIYNPTLTELRNFSNWLWSADPITQLAQMFNDPMNGIIGLHSIYVTPHTDGSKTIGVGYLSSGVQSKVVDEQYVTIDCGSVEIPSYFNNANDWSPYTKISCYLPFIGIVDLNTDDIMSSADKQCTINITYKVDVLTGACLCMIRVKRGSIDGVLYQYNGSCSVQLPLTSGNYGTMIASLITTAVGVGTGVGAIAVGGALSALHSKANVQRSGQLGANVGAMGIKKPYLIIERPYSKYAGSYAKHIGYPSNHTVTLSSCKGFTRVKASDVTNINTTEEERNMIYELLKNGVYV